MEHLTTETIEKFIKGEYQYQKLREISAHLLTCPKVCLEKLNQIDPDFLAEAERIENIRQKEVSQGIHFSDDEIEAYVTKEFGLEKRKEMNRHLTKCRICSTKLKDRDPDYLSNFIQDNLNRDHLSKSEIVAKAEEFRFNFRVLIPAAAFSILLLVLLFTILMLPNNTIIDQAKLQDFPSPTPLTNVGLSSDSNKNPVNIEYSNKKITEVHPISNSETNKQNTGSTSEPPVKTTNVSTISKLPKKEQIGRQQIIVKNRSLNKICENNPALALTPRNEVITETQPNLAWKPLAKAVSYKIYVNDTENNLIEEANLPDVQKTSYQLTKKLEMNKKYEWKVVGTLADGKEVYSQSAYFSVGEKAKKLPQSKDKSKVNEVRCLKTPN